MARKDLLFPSRFCDGTSRTLSYHKKSLIILKDFSDETVTYLGTFGQDFGVISQKRLMLIVDYAEQSTMFCPYIQSLAVKVCFRAHGIICTLFVKTIFSANYCLV